MRASRPTFMAPPAPPSWPVDDYSKDAGCIAATAVRASYVEPKLRQHTFPSAAAGCAQRWAGAATSIALVHVGKTGGESLVTMLQGAGVAFNWIHDPGAAGWSGWPSWRGHLSWPLEPSAGSLVCI